MSVSICAFIEHKSASGWYLYKDMDRKHHEPGFNLAPISWGRNNFDRYYKQSAEKGLPDDLSPGIQQIIEQQQADLGDDAINRPSWLKKLSGWFFGQTKKGK